MECLNFREDKKFFGDDKFLPNFMSIKNISHNSKNLQVDKAKINIVAPKLIYKRLKSMDNKCLNFDGQHDPVVTFDTLLPSFTIKTKSHKEGVMVHKAKRHVQPTYKYYRNLKIIKDGSHTIFKLQTDADLCQIVLDTWKDNWLEQAEKHGDV